MLHEVETELKRLKLGKAPGMDGISNEFYRYFTDYLLHPLTTLYNYIWENGVYPDKWSKDYRTSDNVFILDTLISYQNSKRKPLYVTFIDFSKAFDFVNRTFLYYKMIKKGFGGKLVKIIESMFSKSSARVRWEGELGESIDSTHGVLQGGIVSPKLFNFFQI